MRGKRYRIGIDVGLNSVGLAAVEVSDENSPVRLLNAQSVIHDGGVDPQKNSDYAKEYVGCRSSHAAYEASEA